MDAFIRFTQQHMPFLLAMIFHFTEGMSITAIQGENKVIQWTMDPVPPSNVVVTVLHPSGAIVYTALGTNVLPGASDIGKRVSNTDNTNTKTGNIEFTLNSITVQDAGNYIFRYNPQVGSVYVQKVGVTLFIYVKPSKPVITKTDGTNVVNSTLVLKCSATSNSKPDGHSLQMNYTWYRNGADLPVEERYVTSKEQLQVNNIQRADKDIVVTCRAYETTSLLSEASDGYTVNVKYGPNVVLPNITRLHVVTENSVMIGPICSADCDPACTYQWVFDGVDNGSPGNTLTINNIQRTSTGTYWCVASNDYGTGLSKNVTVNVQYGPGTVSPESPRNHILVENTGVLGPITCSSDCEPACKYQWVFNGVNFGSPGDILTINNIQRTSAGTYWCAASNDIGTERSNNISVTVQYRPDIVLPNIEQGHTLVENTDSLGPIICSADCEPECTYQWMLNGEIQVAAGDTLTINNIQRTSAGTYWCIAANKLGAGVSKHVTATIHYAPDIPELTSSAETTATENTSLSITCSTHGIPLPNITIKSVEWNGKHYVTQSSTNYTVTLQRADCRDTGRYICVAENEIGKSFSKETNINITCLPKQKMGENRTQTILLNTDENLNMTVNFISNPLATVYWSFRQTGKFDKHRLANNTKDFLVVNDNENVWTQSTATRHSMRLEYFGEYMLHASNPLGSTDVSFNVSPKSASQPPVQIRAYCISSTMTELLLLADKDLNVTIDIQTSTNGEDFTDVKSEIDYTNYPVIISNVYGLEPGTLYYFKVTSSSVFGKTESQKYQSCLTPGEKKNTEQSAEVKSMFYAAAAMLAIALILILLVPIITVIILRRNRPSTNSTSKRYEDIGANLPPQEKSPDKDYQEMEPISSLYQELGPQDLPTVYEKFGAKNDKGGNESHYMHTTKT